MSNYSGVDTERKPEVLKNNRSPKEFLLGRFVSGLSEEHDPIRVPLPDGYSYASPSSISISEIAKLWGLRRDGIRLARIKQINYGRTVIDVGVRNTSQRLVGKGAVVHDNKGNGQFADFIVRPQDRGLGIGKAIIDERLRIAESLGIGSIYVLGLESTNTLASYYLEKGFVRLEDGGLGLGPLPTPIIV